jgi:aminopeptidase N
MWLNEGFAEFMPGQYWGQKLGAHAEQDYYLDEYRQYMQIEARRSMPLASLGSNNIYPKGALVLRMLEHELGPQRFWAGIHTYLTRHAFGVATTDDLRQAFLAATGKNLDRFFSEWIYQAGYPQLAVTAAYDSAAHALDLTIKQTQTDSLKPDSTGLKFTVPPVFHMPLVVRVGTAQGDVTRRVALDAREQTVTIPGVASAPTMVIFDDGDAVLKSLDFPQPTAWLATQLARDPNLWNRQWVIEQLASRKDDAAAGAALARAATQADYYLTRREAALALGGFPAATALPALEAAVRDTSAAVRSGALESLGRIGGPRAIALARDAFAHDSSYEVEAAAVTALGRADSAHAGTIIAEALRDSSYQDVIQTAALRLIAFADDTARIGTVDSLVGATQNAAFVLAALAARGSTHALDLLAGHLDDANPGVRRWALRAFQFGLPRPLALARLRAAVDHLTHPDTQRTVRQAIERLSGEKGGM